MTPMGSYIDSRLETTLMQMGLYVFAMCCRGGVCGLLLHTSRSNPGLTSLGGVEGVGSFGQVK